MSKPVILRPAADRDLDEIVDFLRKESRQAAVRFAEAVAATGQLIGDHPGIGSARHTDICRELPKPLRFQPVSGFPRILVYYLERSDGVEIIRVWDSARGLEALMEDLKGDPPAAREPRPAYRVASRA
jgi:toxin ParE1/3/4